MLPALSKFAVDYSYNYTPSTPTSASTPALFWVLLSFLAIVCLAVVVFMLIAYWKVFVKAGRPGWASLIPFYNSWVIAEMAGKPGWWGLFPLLGIIPFVGGLLALVVFIILCVSLAEKFGKSALFGVFGLGIFSVVGWPVLAFGSATYNADTASVSGSASPPYPPVAPVAAAPVDSLQGSSTEPSVPSDSSTPSTPKSL